MRLLCLFVGAAMGASAGELKETLHPAGGGSFEVELSSCKDKVPLLNGRLINNTDANWLYVELQVKVTHGSTSGTYRFNLERIGEKGANIRHTIDELRNV